MNEKEVVVQIVKSLKASGYTVATEISNLYRSADIALIDDNGSVWVIECKISDISKAIRQLETHKLSADKVFIGTPYRKTKPSTLRRIKEAGIGLLYLMSDGTIKKAIDVENQHKPYPPVKELLQRKILRDGL